MTSLLLAHQGGWDEILLVLVPILLFAVLLVVANRRANTIEGQRSAKEDDQDGPDRPMNRHGR